MICRIDNACNLIGTTNIDPSIPRLMIGSHIDTVPNGGKYDGALGIVLGIALIQSLCENRSTLPLAIDVVSFSEEEGVRYRSPYIGSTAIAGHFDASLLDRMDDDHVSLRHAIKSFGCQPDELDSCRIDGSKYIAFLEPHIEQGPVLEQLDLPVGVVTGIAGQSRVTARFIGTASHAGTVPMHLRHDALAAAAEWILAVEKFAKKQPGLLATVGHALVHPNVPNVIAGEVAVRLDCRSMDDKLREISVSELKAIAQQIAAKRDLQFLWERAENQAAVPTSETANNLLAHSISDCELSVQRLQSGAGHDSAVMASIMPTTMLFIRCKGGISHHPDESVEVDDIAVALQVMHRFVCLAVDRVCIRDKIT